MKESTVMDQRRTKLQRLQATSCLLLAVLAGPRVAHAQTTFQNEPQQPPSEKREGDELFEGTFEVNDQDPEAHLPSLAARNDNPVDFGNFLFQLGDKAGAAKQRGDKAAVVKFYRALVAAVPEVSISYSKLCEAYEDLGDLAKAERSCQLALSKPGARPQDFEHYVRLVLDQPDTPRAAQITNLNILIDHLKAKPSVQPLAWQLDCQVAARLGESSRLEACIGELAKRKVSESIVVPFRWKLAMLQLKFGEAGQLAQAAAQAGVPQAQLGEMDAELQRTLHPPAPPESRSLALRPKQLAILIAASLAVLAAWLLWARPRSRATSKPPVA
jgi:hypothetical protein